MKLDKNIASQFRLDMEGVVSFWEKEQHKLYEQVVQSLREHDFTNPQSIKAMFKHNLTYDNLPTRIYQYAFRSFNEDKSFNFTSVEELYKFLSQYSSAVEKGQKYEDWLSDMLSQDSNFLNIVKDVIGFSFTHTGGLHKREDFELTKEFTLDVKYSDTQDPTNKGRYRNIVKEFGGNLYMALHQIEDNIIRSLYSGGASSGAIHTAQGKSKGLYSFKTVKGRKQFEETATTTNTSSHRKILIYMYPENAYWASVCLEHLIDWAAKRLEDTNWVNANTRAGQKASDDTLRTFQGFWYGK